MATARFGGPFYKHDGVGCSVDTTSATACSRTAHPVAIAAHALNRAWSLSTCWISGGGPLSQAIGNIVGKRDALTHNTAEMRAARMARAFKASVILAFSCYQIRLLSYLMRFNAGLSATTVVVLLGMHSSASDFMTFEAASAVLAALNSLHRLRTF